MNDIGNDNKESLKNSTHSRLVTKKGLVLFISASKFIIPVLSLWYSKRKQAHFAF